MAVRIEHSGARPALPGVTVTADSSGVASGYVTQASARAFGDALTRQWVADRKAGHALSSGLFAGIHRIRTADADAGRGGTDVPHAHPGHPGHGHRRQADAGRRWAC